MGASTGLHLPSPSAVTNCRGTESMLPGPLPAHPVQGRRCPCPGPQHPCSRASAQEKRWPLLPDTPGSWHPRGQGTEAGPTPASGARREAGSRGLPRAVLAASLRVSPLCGLGVAPMGTQHSALSASELPWAPSPMTLPPGLVFSGDSTRSHSSAGRNPVEGHPGRDAPAEQHCAQGWAPAEGAPHRTHLCAATAGGGPGDLNLQPPFCGLALRATQAGVLGTYTLLGLLFLPALSLPVSMATPPNSRFQAAMTSPSPFLPPRPRGSAAGPGCRAVLTPLRPPQRPQSCGPRSAGHRWALAPQRGLPARSGIPSMPATLPELPLAGEAGATVHLAWEVSPAPE
ncbi:collagen alpha-2(I) chain-like [Manis pentadactyla]|uniref:collagen alpha-2(I) chain-like n=1 Tax=Manis pentadactyla TaxID=143292 RepID=UPI00255CBD3F|nr:collagen alpha-2(I) chain-like [Manis pentadactyla]